MIARRHLLATIPALAVAACAGQTAPQLTTYVQAIAGGLAGILTDLQAAGVKIPPATTSAIQTELDVIRQDADAIGTALTPDPDMVAAIGAAVSALVPLVTPFFPAAPGVAVALQAALALVPVILAMVGHPVAGAAPTMSPAAALLVLQGNARRYGR